MKTTRENTTEVISFLCHFVVFAVFSTNTTIECTEATSSKARLLHIRPRAVLIVVVHEGIQFVSVACILLQACLVGGGLKSQSHPVKILVSARQVLCV